LERCTLIERKFGFIHCFVLYEICNIILMCLFVYIWFFRMTFQCDFCLAKNPFVDLLCGCCDRMVCWVCLYSDGIAVNCMGLFVCRYCRKKDVACCLSCEGVICTIQSPMDHFFTCTMESMVVRKCLLLSMQSLRYIFLYGSMKCFQFMIIIWKDTLSRFCVEWLYFSCIFWMIMNCIYFLWIKDNFICMNILYELYCNNLKENKYKYKRWKILFWLENVRRESSIVYSKGKVGEFSLRIFFNFVFSTRDFNIFNNWDWNFLG